MKFTEQEILDIAAYIQSIGGGPEIPTAEQVSTEGANTALGSQLFTGQLRAVPRLRRGRRGAHLRQVRACADPVHPHADLYRHADRARGDAGVLRRRAQPAAKRDIIAYIVDTRIEPNPGGLSLGRIGPVTEGLVVFLGGMGFLVLIAMWLTAKRREPWDVAQEENAREARTAGTSGTSGTEH